jgi:hypothetical protein
MNNGCVDDKISDNNIVVKYDNNHSVTINDLHKYVKDWLYYKKFPDRSDAYNNALKDMVTNQLKRIDFFEKGLDKNQELVQSINRIINEELVAEYFETQYLGKFTTEENAKKIYGMMNREVVYQMIELSKPVGASQKQLDSLKEKALAIKSEIDNGKDFSLLVKKYSQNKTSLMNNGFMPPLGWKQSFLYPHNKVIYNLNKNDVRILNSTNAFLIVKIADINYTHLEPYDSLKDEIISDLKSIYVDSSLTEYEKDKDQLIDNESLKWNSAALKEIVQWSNIPNFYRSEYQKTFKDAIENGNNKIILTYNGGTVDYKELLRLLNNVLIIRDFRGMEEEHIKKYLAEAIRTDLIVKKAESLDLKKNIFYAFTANPALKYQIVKLYNQAEIEAKLPEATDEALHRFYKENENTLYYQLEKRNLFVMVFPNKVDAEKALVKINTGTPFEKVTGVYSVKTYIKERDDGIKSFGKDENPIFGKVGFELKESEVTGPIEFKDENDQSEYALIKCYHIRPEKQLTYNDVSNSITEDFKNYHREIIEKEIEVQLRNKYNPIINEKVLAKVIAAE